MVSSNSFFSFVAIAKSASVAGFTGFTELVDLADSREIFRLASAAFDDVFDFDELFEVCDFVRLISSSSSRGRHFGSTFYNTFCSSSRQWF